MAGKARLDRVRVSGMEFQIIEDPSLVEKGILGECQFVHNRILIAPQLPPVLRVVTELHEFWHVQMFAAGIQGQDHCERTMTTLSHGLVPLFSDNPTLWGMMGEAVATRQPKRNLTRK